MPSLWEGRSPTERRVLLAAVVLLVASVVYAVLSTAEEKGSPGGLDVRWDERGTTPACTYDEGDGAVTARVRVRGTAPAPQQLTVTVSAYADENTSREVGSRSRTLSLDGAVDEDVVLTIPVDRPPHVDVDGVAACRLSSRG